MDPFSDTKDTTTPKPEEDIEDPDQEDDGVCSIEDDASYPPSHSNHGNNYYYFNTTNDDSQDDMDFYEGTASGIQMNEDDGIPRISTTEEDPSKPTAKDNYPGTADGNTLAGTAYTEDASYADVGKEDPTIHTNDVPGSINKKIPKGGNMEDQKVLVIRPPHTDSDPYHSFDMDST